MIKKIKMYILENKIRQYGRMLEEYRLKELKYQYYVNKVKEYTYKVSEAQSQYKQLIEKEGSQDSSFYFYAIFQQYARNTICIMRTNLKQEGNYDSNYWNCIAYTRGRTYS